VKIDYISDLHICHWVKENDTNKLKFKAQLENYITNILLPVKEDFNPGDVLIIAGDISHYNNKTKSLLIELKNIYKEIIITFGNHDFYLVSNSIIKKYKSKSSNRISELKDICNELDIHFLDGKVITIDGIRFGGTGSWYNLKSDLEISQWKKVMNDSKYIYSGIINNQNVGMYGMDSYNSRPKSNWKTQDFWLSEKAKLLEISKDNCDIFITHIALNEPTSEEGMADEYIGDQNNIFYYTDNFELLKMSDAKVHIHGHTHQSLDYTKDGIRILCNPLGYPGDNTYNYIKQIEI